MRNTLFGLLLYGPGPVGSRVEGLSKIGALVLECKVQRGLGLD
jgi:hypothetical protein